MDDCISRQAALNVEVSVTTTLERLEAIMEGMALYAEEIKKLPTANIRSVLVCQECKWWSKQEASIQGRCALHGLYPTGGWFCANAEKSEA